MNLSSRRRLSLPHHDCENRRVIPRVSVTRVRTKPRAGPASLKRVESKASTCSAGLASGLSAHQRVGPTLLNLVQRCRCALSGSTIAPLLLADVLMTRT